MKRKRYRRQKLLNQGATPATKTSFEIRREIATRVALEKNSLL